MGRKALKTAAVDLGPQTVLTEQQAAEILQVPPGFLARNRTKSDESRIPYQKLGHRTVRYRLGDLHAYLNTATRGGGTH